MALVTYISPTQPTVGQDGFVAHKNRGQVVLRARALPIQPQKINRGPVNNLITQLSVPWELLTNSQRTAWGTYAYNSPLTDAWGNPVYVKGYAHYMRANRPRLQHSLPRIDDGPTNYGFPDYTLPFVADYGSGYAIQITPQTSDAWATEDGAYMLVWVSRPAPVSRTRPPETYQRFTLLAGSSTTPPPPVVATLPFPASPPDSMCWVRTAVTRADGRYTSSEAYP